MSAAVASADGSCQVADVLIPSSLNHHVLVLQTMKPKFVGPSSYYVYCVTKVISRVVRNPTFHDLRVGMSSIDKGHSVPHQQNGSNNLELPEVVDRPPSSHDEAELSTRQPVKTSSPLSLHVLALLIPSSTLGLLARLGLLALGTYNGSSIFPLIYVQAVGCLIMGFAVGVKEPLGRLYVIQYLCNLKPCKPSR